MKGKVRVWQLNGKIERFFRTMKNWIRTTWMIPSTDGMQRRFSEYQVWYNEHRMDAALEAHTPEDRVRDIDPSSILYNVNGGIEPVIRVTRQSARGDPKLFQLEIKVKERKKAA